VRDTVPPGTEFTEEALANRMVDDIFDGADGKNIRSGIIGEIGMEWPTGHWERMVLRAAAKAQNQTGASISIHLGRSPNSPFDAIHILRDAGADLSRVVLCHIERTVFDMDRIVELAETGCYIEHDTFSIEGFGERVRMVMSEEKPVRMDWPSDPQRVEQIVSLVRAGVVDRILISSDMCRKHRLWRYGGPGYGHILMNIIPLMRERGMQDEDIHTIIVENPKRLLTFP
jgi:phosphotriesterase-related protein